MPSNTAPRSAPQLKQARNPISRKQVEPILSRSVAAVAFVFGAQSIGPLLGQIHESDQLWVDVVVTAFFASILVALTFSIINRLVKIGHGLVAATYVIALVTWPFAIHHPQVQVDNYWLYYVLTVGTSTAGIALSTRFATIYLFIVPMIYGAIRMTPAGGSESPPHAALDSIYAIIQGGAVNVVITMLRQAASNVDTAQGTALERYGHAVRQHATEIERVQVDSIVHDSVLTTLISAARAYSPEAMELAAVMAGNAIGHLHDAALVQPDDGTTVRLRAVAKRIADAAGAMSARFEVRAMDVGSRSIPSSASEAVYSAAVQAMVNSIQHGGDAKDLTRWIAMKSVRPGGIEVEVGDNGRGFKLESIPTERLGVRVSIIERVANAGGSVAIESAPGEGTVVRVRWPVPAAAPEQESAISGQFVDGEATR
jgi:two-component sensor histidine kinase